MAPESTVAEREAWASERRTIEALRAGDESAFRALFARVYPMMRRVARTYVDSDAVAEEIVQETWIAIVTGIHRFQGRSALDTWIFSILLKQAKAHRARERRALPFSSLAGSGTEAGTVEVGGVDAAANTRPGRWAIPPRPWQSSERRLLSLEIRGRLRAALAELPERQRLVVALRDVEGRSAEEVSEMLELSSVNQRVLLHRGRARLRSILGDYLVGDDA